LAGAFFAGDSDAFAAGFLAAALGDVFFAVDADLLVDYSSVFFTMAGGLLV